MTTSRVRVAISLGANEGDRAVNLRFGLAGLAGLLSDLNCSSIYETTPLHVRDQPTFLNACCTGFTSLEARELLLAMRDIEEEAGRERSGARYGPRPLDLDLLLYDHLVVSEPGFTVPHARMRERAFVLIPLAEIAPTWVVPGSAGAPAATVGELASGVEGQGIIQLAQGIDA